MKTLRRHHQLTQDQLAQALSTSQQTIARWESGSNDIPVAQLKELAVYFGVSVDHILGVNTPYEQQGRSPFAIANDAEMTPYGTLKLILTIGELEYPIDNASRLSLLHQMNEFDIQSSENIDAWMYCWTLDNKILFVNPRALIEFELISDDVMEMPEYSHPEVYQALEDLEFAECELGSRVKAACDELIALEGEERAIKRVTHVRLVALSGKVSWHHLNEPADTEAYFAMHLEASSQIKPFRMIRTESEGYHRERYVNLDQVALMEIPSNRYHKLMAEEA